MPKKAWSDKDLAYIERVAGKVPVPVMAAAMNERCCRCHITLTSEDKYHYGANCEACNTDYLYEDHERDQPIKSAYWRWRAICFCVRFLFCGAVRVSGLLLHKLRNKPDAGPQLPDVRREP